MLSGWKLNSIRHFIFFAGLLFFQVFHSLMRDCFLFLLTRIPAPLLLFFPALHINTSLSTCFSLFLFISFHSISSLSLWLFSLFFSHLFRCEWSPTRDGRNHRNDQDSDVSRRRLSITKWADNGKYVLWKNEI